MSEKSPLKCQTGEKHRKSLHTLVFLAEICFSFLAVHYHHPSDSACFPQHCSTYSISLLQSSQENGLGFGFVKLFQGAKNKGCVSLFFM